MLPLVTGGCDRQPSSFADVQSGQIAMADGDRLAIERLLSDARLDPAQLDMVGSIGAANWLQLDSGRVQSLQLSGLKLADLSSIAALTSLQSLRISDGQLDSLNGLPQSCALTSIHVERAQLADAAPVSFCRSLRHLSLPGNLLTQLPKVSQLAELRHLDLSDNLLDHIEISHLQNLQSLNLANNRLLDCPLVAKLPSLRRLVLSGNRIVDLHALRDLPELEDLLADNNRLLDASALDDFPRLAVINLNQNQLARFPARVSSLDPLMWSENPGYLQRIADDHDQQRARLTAFELVPDLPQPNEQPDGWSSGSCQWSRNRPSCQLSFARVSGVQRIYLARWQQDPQTTDPRRRGVSGVVVRLQAGQGTIRAYLQRQARAVRRAERDPAPAVEVGFPYIEATPNDPRALAGQLLSDGSGVWLLLEASDGPATDVDLSVEPGYVP